MRINGNTEHPAIFKTFENRKGKAETNLQNLYIYISWSLMQKKNLESINYEYARLENVLL